MGVAQLAKLIRENTKKGYRERHLSHYVNKRVAIDASMSIYQFLIAIRSDSGALGADDKATSHLVGMFYRTISMVEGGIRPVFVFDGVAPELKLNELLKRKGRREVALSKYEEAKAVGDAEKMEMYEKRQTKITPVHVGDCKRLLHLMGIPFIEAPSEAEAYCAFMVREGMADAVATEDMDALAFGAPILLRNVNASKSKKLPIQEYNQSQILADLGLTQDQFIDLCILLGCDFCEGIKGVGPKTALSLIREFKTIENILAHKANLEVASDWGFEKARLIFQNLADGDEKEVGDIRWDCVDVEGVKGFLVNEHGFSEERVVRGMERFLATREKGNQATLDSFFRAKK